MPVLDWIGKDKVVNHHLDVPYHVLEQQYSFDKEGQHEEDNGSENMIIHGDNLLALKSLLPQYEGRVKCIYIDPPYNTGNESWVYNDNVNDPRIKKWLGEVVGKEGEDLSRHDKWLCMMYPRLKLLQRLLSDNGVIFISIDDAEYANLKLICDEIFGTSNFVSNISWQRTYSIRNDSKGVPIEVEHILVYSKNPNWQPHKLERTEKMNASYSNPDGDRCDWMSGSPVASDAITHQGMVYAIQHPFTGKYFYPSAGAHWRYSQDQMLEYMNGWCKYELKDLHDDEERAKVCGIAKDEVRKNVKAIVLSEPLELSKKHAQEVYEKGPWPRFYFTNGGQGGVRRKVYLDDVGGRISTNLWEFVEVGHTDEAKKETKKIFGGQSPFDTPKPVRLIERIIQIASDPDSIILDSFAGSGTTAHAVLNMNRKDGGNRKFILVEMEDYADTTTAERVKRAIIGFSKDEESVLFDEEITAKNLAKGAEILSKAKETAKEAKASGTYSSVKQPKIEDGHLHVVAVKKAKDQEPGLPGNFSFYELGSPIFNGENLNEEIGEDEIRKYVYFTETKQVIEPRKEDEPYYMGTHVDTAYYFNYEKDQITTLNRDFLSTVKTKADSYVIYADRCTLSQRELENWHITFKKIPRDISRL